MRTGKIIRYSLVGLLAIIVGVLIIGSFTMLDMALKPTYGKGRDLEGSLARIRKDYPHTISWIDSLQTHEALKDTFITTDDGRQLHAFYVRAPKSTAKTALLLHGYTDRAIRMLPIGYIYHHLMGYNLLLPDMQAHGESDGEVIQMGWKDCIDIKRWSQIADVIFGNKTRQVVHGISMGGFMTMVLAGEDIPQMEAFVDDCGYTSVWDEFANELKASFGLSEFPLMYTTSLLCKIRYGWSFGEADAVKKVRNSEKPIFFIHGDKDRYVPTHMVHTLYDAKPQPKELWLTPGVEHAMSFYTYPEEYAVRVVNFCWKYLH